MPIDEQLPLSSRELREGDVLLSYGLGGTGSTSYWARVCDGGLYSHAAYWDGREVIEAVSGGVRATGLDLHLDEHEYVDAYRFIGRPPRGEGASVEWDPAAVTTRVRAYIGAGYATTRLATIGLMVGLGRLTGVPAFMEFLASWGEAFRQEVDAWDAAGRAQRPMVCSELVASAFYEATPDHRLALEILLAPGQIAEGVPDPDVADADIEELVKRCRQSLLAPDPDEKDASDDGVVAEVEMLGAQPRERTAGRDILLTRVTPADLQRSPSLEALGRLTG